MNAATKLGAFGLVLVAVLGGGALLGGAVGPIDTGAPDEHDEHDDHEPAGATSAATPERELPAGGLLVSQDGYTFAPLRRELDGAPFAFTITGPDGAPVLDYEELHDRRLHLIVASRDLRSYAHVHPTLAEDGTWTVDLPALPPGSYRAFADLRPAGADQVTLGIDVTVPGAVEPAAPFAPSAHDHVDDLDLELRLDGGTATVTVRRDGEVVTTEPYLGAAGHLVALRDGDLAYLHVHPLDDEPAGPVAFAVDLPSAGRYALFFDFQLDGVVRTGRFVIDADAGGASGTGHGGH